MFPFASIDSYAESNSIANRVKARNKKARKKIIHKESQHFKAQKEDNTSSPEPYSIEY